MPIRVLGFLVGGAVTVAIISTVLYRLVRRQETRSDEETRDLVADLVAETLVEKLNQPRQRLFDALKGRPADSELRRMIDNALRSVELIFRRAGEPGTSELKIEVRCADGEIQSAV